MPREILTYPISKAAMWQELEFLVDTLVQLDQLELKASFGFAWAEEFHAGWNEITVSGPELLSEVRRMEASEKGELGFNDLFIRLPQLAVEFHYCNDSDIHLTFDQPSDFTESFYSRWKARGFTPAEWLKETVV